MRYISSLILACALAAMAMPAHAAERSVTLKVEGMTCAGCPYQVKRSLTKVEGVRSAEVSLETKRAVVTYDDAETNVAALTAATAEAGFPSAPVNESEKAVQ